MGRTPRSWRWTSAVRSAPKELRKESWGEAGIKELLAYEALPPGPFDPPRLVTMKIRDIPPRERERIAGHLAKDLDAEISFAPRRPPEPEPDESDYAGLGS